MHRPLRCAPASRRRHRRGDRRRADDLRDILAAVTPGGGKSLLPVIAAQRG